MRVLSRIFGGLLVAVTILFAGTSSSFADEMPDNQSDCQAAGWIWDEDSKQCCWLLGEKDGDTICVGADNWSNFGLDVDKCPQPPYSDNEQVGYLDPSGELQCCPQDSTLNLETHQCECEPGFYLNTESGQCEQIKLAVSKFCGYWKEIEPGYFFNYLMGKLTGGLINYRSAYTCDELITKIPGGSSLLESDPDNCRCSCADSALTFNPGAAIDCYENNESCDNICVDLNDAQTSCPPGQQSYYINDEWECCIFYDPEQGTCIQTDSEWVTYIKSLGEDFKDGGGYIGPDGLPIPCPDIPGVYVDERTGRCVCSPSGGGGWFDTTTGRCTHYVGLHLRKFSGSNPTGYDYRTVHYTNTLTSTMGLAPGSHDGYYDSNNHRLFNASGDWIFSSLYPSSPNTQFSTITDYIATTPGTSYVTAWRYIVLTLKRNHSISDSSQQVTRHRVTALGANSFSPVIVEPTRTGYTFDGWWLNSSGNSNGNIPTSDLQYVTADATYYAQWKPVVSGAITLDSKRYTSNSASSGTSVLTNSSPGTVYTKYNTGVYTSSANATNGTNAINTLSTLPKYDANDTYAFDGFYTTKATGGTKVVNADGTFTADAKTQVSTTGGTATWYARWVENTPSSVTITYNCGGGSGTTPSSVTIAPGSNFSPATNTCTKNGYVFTGWKISDTNDIRYPGRTLPWNYTTNKTATAQWSKFAVDFYTSGASGTTFSFTLSAKGTFTINCGDGGTLSGTTGVSGNTITRTNTSDNASYTCTYTGGDTKMFGIDGTATDYRGSRTYGNTTFSIGCSGNSTVTGIRGSLGSVFPTIGAGTLSNSQPMFYDTFNGCSGITSIPEGLFTGITGGAELMFKDTFASTGITSLPENLFAGITTTSSGSNAQTFFGTFVDSPNLTGFIPPSMFRGLVANGSPAAPYGMYTPFRSNGSLATSCPSGKTQYFTGYESVWNGYVSCASNKVTYNCGTGSGTAPVNSGVVNGLHFRVSANTCTAPAGYSFAGWKVSGTNDIKAENTHFEWQYGNVDKTFTAQWSQDFVTVTLKKNGGSGTCGGSATTSDITLNNCAVGGNCTLPQWDYNNCNITNGNKIFVGWATSQTATTATYGYANFGTNSWNTTFNSNTTLWAVWKNPDCSQISNATSAVATTTENNSPQCNVVCNTGYGQTGIHGGTVGDPVVNSDCTLRTVRILSDSNGGSGSTTPSMISCYYDSDNCTLMSYNSGNMSGPGTPNSATPFAKWLCRIGMNNASGTSCGYFNSGQTLTTSQMNTLVLADDALERTLYACWNYNINFKESDGTSISTDTYNNCEAKTISNVPTKEGYTFSKWCTDTALTQCTENPVISAGSTGTKTYYAKWTPKIYNISYTLNGGHIPPVQDGYLSVDYIQSQNSNSAFSYFDTPIKFDFGKDFRVVGSFNNPDTSRKILLGSYKNTSNVLNLALWDSGVFRTYFASGYAGNSSAITPNTWTSYNTYYDPIIDKSRTHVGNLTLNVNAPDITGEAAMPIRMFLDWRGNTSNYENPVKMRATAIYQNDSLEAYYMPAIKKSTGECGMYDIKTDDFIGSATASKFVCPENTNMPITYAYTVGASISGIPVREHSIFQGWCTNSALTSGCSMSQTISASDTGNKAYYAKWACDKGYHISGNACVANSIRLSWTTAHGSVPGTPAASCTYGGTFTAPSSISATGYDFGGWTVNGLTFAAGATVSCNELSLGVVSDTVSIAAVWTTNTYTITLNDNGGSGGDGSVKEVYNTEWKNSAGTQTITDVTIPTKAASGSNYYVFTGYWSATSGGTNKIPSDGTLPATNTFSANTTVYAQFGTCACTPGDNVSSCDVTGVTDNQCQYTYTCANGYTTGGNGSDTFAGDAGVASNTSPGCSGVTSYKLTLQKHSSTCSFAAKYYYYVPSSNKWYSNANLTTEVTGTVNDDPSCTGYTFRGWYWNNPTGYNDNISNSDPDKGEFVQQNTTIASGHNAPSTIQPYAKSSTNLSGKTISADTILKARWAKNCVTVANGSCVLTVDANGDTNGNVTYTGSCDTGYDLSGNGTYNPTCTLATCDPGYYMSSGACTACGAGYYCLGGTTRSACPPGLTTANDTEPKRHDEAGDCGRPFHLGTDDTLWLRSSKKTHTQDSKLATVALNFDYFAANGTAVKDGGTPDGVADLFLNLSTTASPMPTTNKNFKMTVNGSTVYGCDDGTCK